MLHISFAMTSEAFADTTKTETRRFWKPGHAAKFAAGTEFMGITKDFRAGGVKMHAARVVFCRQEHLGDMSDDSFLREGATRYWPDREAYIVQIEARPAYGASLSNAELGVEVKDALS